VRAVAELEAAAVLAREVEAQLLNLEHFPRSLRCSNGLQINREG